MKVQALEDRPTIPEHLAPVIWAMKDLAPDAAMTGQVPFTAAVAWCHATGCDDVFWLWDRIQAMQGIAADG